MILCFWLTMFFSFMHMVCYLSSCGLSMRDRKIIPVNLWYILTRIEYFREFFYLHLNRTYIYIYIYNPLYNLIISLILYYILKKIYKKLSMLKKKLIQLTYPANLLTGKKKEEEERGNRCRSRNYRLIN
jgi:hypothetical protein